MKVSSEIDWSIGSMDIHIVLTLTGPPYSNGYEELYEVVVVAEETTVEFTGRFSKPHTDVSLANWLHQEIQTRLRPDTTLPGKRSYIN